MLQDNFDSVACRLVHVGIRRHCERQQLADYLNRLQERRSLPTKMQGNLLSYEMLKEVARPCVMNKGIPNLRPAHKPRTG